MRARTCGCVKTAHFPGFPHREGALVCAALGAAITATNSTLMPLATRLVTLTTALLLAAGTDAEAAGSSKLPADRDTRHLHKDCWVPDYCEPGPPTRAPRVLSQHSNPNPGGARISPQCLCIVLSTVQLSAHGAHPTPCTIRGRAGLSRRGAPLGQAGERATTLDQCVARNDNAACPCSFEVGCGCYCCCCCGCSCCC